MPLRKIITDDHSGLRHDLEVETMEITLRQLQLLELETAKEIKRICEKHNIPYFLADGTLLGAVRHQGFIPWDDDMDLGMELDAYLQFLACAPEELDERFILQTWENDPRYGGLFVKVRMKHTFVQEAVVPDGEICKGIWVDIFPMIPANGKEISKWKLAVLWLLAKAYRIKCGYQLNRITENKIGRLLNIILSVLVKFCSQTWLRNTYKNRLMKYYCPQGDVLVESDGNFSEKQVFHRDWYATTQQLPFEDTHFPVPSEYHKVLETLYGDYMQFPPIEEQEKGHSLSGCMVEQEYATYFHN